MSDLVLPAGWRAWSDDELRNFIKITELAYQRTEKSMLAGVHTGYFLRLYRARLLVLRNELDRRIRRQSDVLAAR